ncbi:hypothetical protein E2C01_095733 [Portunus trituberculatus]|uniref:Uncharacterized protein n=1 Tax=Portunus trituberculatus TaxID=210409 RepID=A0A5B7JW18_PORTR|nr:hypothetical protein [Portunus trituberculatus]
MCISAASKTGGLYSALGASLYAAAAAVVAVASRNSEATAGGNNATGSRAFTGPESIHVEAARRRLQEMDANLIFSSPRLMLDPDFIQLSSPTLWSITDEGKTAGKRGGEERRESRRKG